MRNQLLQNESSDSGASAHNQDTTTVPGPAALCGKIEIGDRVVRVNDENCSGHNSNEVDVLLRDASRPVTLLFERLKAGGSGATSTSKTDQKKLECLLRELDPVTGPAKALEQHALSSFAIRGAAQTSVESGLSGVVDQAGVAGRPSSSDVTQKVVPDNLFLAVQCNVCGRSATSIPGGQLLACGRCQ